MKYILIILLFISAFTIATEKENEKDANDEDKSLIYSELTIKDCRSKEFKEKANTIVITNDAELKNLTKKDVKIDFTKFKLVLCKQEYYCTRFTLAAQIVNNELVITSKVTSRCKHLSKIGHMRIGFGFFLINKDVAVNSWIIDKRKLN